MMKAEDYSELLRFFEKKGWKITSFQNSGQVISLTVKQPFENVLEADLRWHIDTKGPEWVHQKMEEILGQPK